MPARRIASVLCTIVMFATVAVAASRVVADVPPENAAPAAPPPVTFEAETLENGLRVVYVPMSSAPVVHVRVLYHVGSRDERPDRQGFAHMFEHMMFRGSKHVKPEEHMKLIMQVGGSSNAFTHYDQTTYINTLPANQLELALYLEADRMASFKVSDEILKTERNVVAEEWRMRYANQPYGPMYQDFASLAYQKHSYRWTPIGDMEQLAQTTPPELQAFFNRYYVPNNAVLVIAGDIDLADAKSMVRRYFGWIPRGPEVRRDIPQEPEQAEPRKRVVHRPNVRIPAIAVGYKTPGWRSDDHYALELLAGIIGRGRTSRLGQLLVNSPQPMCINVSASDSQLEDPSLFMINAQVLPNADPEEVERTIREEVEKVAADGITQEELDKVRTQERIGLIRSRELPTGVAWIVGEEALFGGDPNRVNERWEKIAKMTPADLQAVAKKYFRPERMTVLHYLPPARTAAGDANGAATQPAQANGDEILAAETKPAPSTAPAAAGEVSPREITFPADYPKQAPISEDIISKTFEKGDEMDVNGVKVIVMSDHRLPIVNWSLVLRAGGHAEPPGKEGVADLASSMLQRGVEGMDYMALSEDLESRGIALDVRDADDHTRLSGSCVADQLDHAVTRARQILLQPTFPNDEFEKLKQQSLAGLVQALSNPGVVAVRELNAALWTDSPLGRSATVKSLSSITLDDVRNWYTWVYRPNDAILVFSGDITPEQGKAMAEKLIEGWKKSAEPLPSADYHAADAPESRRIILVDNPAGKQSAIRMAVRAYDITSDDKFPGSVASRILSDGIHARLDRYVRAEKGYTYGSSGIFSPGRHGGEFIATADTDLKNTAACIEAMFKVFDDLRAEPPTGTEMAEAKTRVAGGMVMQMQTMAQQAERRIDGILNGYPIDYYDVYPQRINAVAAEQVRDVMAKYVNDDQMVIIVVAPAAEVKAQLERLGPVEVVPMPNERPGMILHPATPESPAKKAA